MKTKKQLRQDFVNEHPVRRAFHTGRYGYERIGDCINLNACTFNTERQAERARNGDAHRWADEQYGMDEVNPNTGLPSPEFGAGMPSGWTAENPYAQ